MGDSLQPGQALVKDLVHTAQFVLENAGERRAEYAESLKLIATALQDAKNFAPTPVTQAIDDSLQQADAGHWDAAEKRLLAWTAQEDLSISERCQVLMYLRDLSGVLGRNAEALAAARGATAAARRIDSEMLLAMQLRDEASCERAVQHCDDALARVEEALAQLPAEPMYDLVRSQLHLERAACYCVQQRFEHAEECLARTEVVAVLSVDLPGWWAAASQYQRLRAEIHAGRGQREEAAAAWRAAVELQRRLADISYLPQGFRSSALADLLAGLAVAETAAGRPRAAHAAQRECNALRRKAHLPTARTGLFMAVVAYARKLLAGRGPKSACSKSPSI